MANLPTKRDIQNRIKDEQRGIRQGAVSLNVEAPKHGDHDEVLPTEAELGLPTSLRRTLITHVTNHAEDAHNILVLIKGALPFGHVELGQIEAAAKKAKDTHTKEIKELCSSHIEARKFFVAGNKLSVYTQNRTSFNKDVARDTLLSLGVPPQKIAKAWEAATKETPVETLRITPPGEDDAAS